MTTTPLLLPVLLLITTADSAFRFASYYGDHMVLQQKPARALVWGYGEEGAQVTVTLKRGTDVVSHPGVNVSGGIWKVLLDPMDFGGPNQLIAQQTLKDDVSSIQLEDVLFGDVWVCGGQSNMQMTVSMVFNASQEMAQAAKYPNIRLFNTGMVESDKELLDLISVDLPWSLPTPQILGHHDWTHFSALCWFFGQHLSKKLKYPIGLVESAWSGTPVESWLSKMALSECGVTCTAKDSAVWNAMIHPLLNMTIKGAIWYQGETNTEKNTDLYNCTFPALIQDWRRSFHEGSLGQTDPNFPFGFVQLSTFSKIHLYKHENYHKNFPVIRWHQTADYGYAPNPKMPNTFMAVTMDLGDEKCPYESVHPRDKQTVAYRLFLGAQAIAYGDHSVPFQGPYPDTYDVYFTYFYMNITYNQQLIIRRTLDNIFEVFCRKDTKGESRYVWVPAPAQLLSCKVVRVWFKGCSHVMAVRYAWSDWPCDYKQCPIYGVYEGLPAPNFIKYFT